MTVQSFMPWLPPLLLVALIATGVVFSFRFGVVRDRTLEPDFDIRRFTNSMSRPIKLIGASVCTLLIVLTLDSIFTGGHLVKEFFYPRTIEGPEWKDLFQATVLTLGLPVGLMLWHWRDLSVRQQIENSRKDTNLKEFSELQLRAAGAIDSDLPLGARVALQVAALHQLRPYLRGESGASFRLAALEIYLAMLEGRVEGTPTEEAERTAELLPPAPVVPLRVHRAVRDIVAEEWRHFFRRGAEFSNRSLQALHLPKTATLADVTFLNCDLRYSDFEGMGLSRLTFDGCNLAEASFAGATITNALFSHTHATRLNLSDAKLIDVRILDSDMKGGDLRRASFSHSHLHRTDFASCDWSRARCVRTVLLENLIENGRFRSTSVQSCAWLQNVAGVSLNGLFVSSDTAIGISANFKEDYLSGAMLTWSRLPEKHRERERQALKDLGALAPSGFKPVTEVS